MPKLTFIGRVSDGMMLCTTYEEKSEEVNTLTSLAKQIMRKLNKQPPIGILDSQSNHTFFYKIEEGIGFLTCAESSFPKAQAFAFLDAIIAEFQEELKKTYGSGGSVDYRSKLETIERPYFFLKFDRQIKRRRQEFMSSEHMSDVSRELEETRHLMRQNINTLLDRDRTLANIDDAAGRLKEDSKLFADRAKKLNLSLWLRQNALWLGFLSFLLVVFAKFYWL
jgi:vesicle transport protein SEC22